MNFSSYAIFGAVFSTQGGNPQEKKARIFNGFQRMTSQLAYDFRLVTKCKIPAQSVHFLCNKKWTIVICLRRQAAGIMSIKKINCNFLSTQCTKIDYSSSSLH